MGHEFESIPTTNSTTLEMELSLAREVVTRIMELIAPK
jgi:hypothetical protein